MFIPTGEGLAETRRQKQPQAFSKAYFQIHVIEGFLAKSTGISTSERHRRCVVWRMVAEGGKLTNIGGRFTATAFWAAIIINHSNAAFVFRG